MAAVLATTLLAGCNLGYLARGGYEAARLLWHRRPIRAELADPDLTPQTREKLEMVLKVREFARDRLGLNVGGAYTSVTPVDEGAITWIVMAAARDSLTPYVWWFPIVGTVPYRGYFSDADAMAEAARLDAQGLDTYVRPAVAFSSLGYFDDPLLSNLLKLGRVELAGVIIHELFHRTFFLKSNVMFNESAANYVGSRGAIDFFAAAGSGQSADAAEARAIVESDLRFADFLQRKEAKLLTLYDSGLPPDQILARRQPLFDAIKADYAPLKHTLAPLARFDLDRQPLNNAVLLSYRIYFHDLGQFAALERVNHGDTRATIQAIIAIGTAHPDDPFFALWQEAQQAPTPPP